jgi:alpha-tubulin suppressor-like RCC1 family protein
VAYLARCALQRRCREAAAGHQHTLFVHAGGKLLACGQGAAVGQGDADAIYSDPTRVAVMAGKRVRSVAAGDVHSLALSWEGRVGSWGGNGSGQLGLGGRLDRLSPTPLDGLEGVCGAASGKRHTHAVTDAGAMFSWGESFQLEALLPTSVVHLSGLRVQSVCAGGGAAFAINEEGQVFSWGHGQDGLLGHGHTSNVPFPMIVEALQDVPVSSIAVALRRALALTEKD